MEEVPQLAAIFLAHVRGGFAPSTEVALLERQLARAWEDARAQWPTVTVAAEVFVRHVAERLPEASPGSPVEQLLEQVSLSELYLACACLQGVPQALAAFERHYLAKLPGMLGSLRHSTASIEDICQMTRMRLLVRTPEGEPRIHDYRGHGALMNWVRVAAVRIAVKESHANKVTPGESVEDVIEALPTPELGAELELIRQRHRAEFRQALREAFSSLPEEDKHLFRLHLLERLSTTELGTIFRVNQSTVSRWLKRVRQSIFDETRRCLQQRLGISPRDFQSLLAVLDSQLDLSISQVLGDEKGLARPEHGG